MWAPSNSEVKMAQAIGGAVIALLVYWFSIISVLVLNHNISLGCVILGIVVWLSTESFIGGVLVFGLALAGLMTGHFTILLIAVVAAIWSFVAWGLKG